MVPGHCSTGPAEGIVPWYVAAPSARLEGPCPGVLSAMPGGPAIHWSRLQCSRCAWAAGPASVPAPLGAVWYKRVEAGTATRAGGEKEQEKLAPKYIHEGAHTNLRTTVLDLLRASTEPAAPHWDWPTTATMHRSQSISPSPARAELQLPPQPDTGRQAGTSLPTHGDGFDAGLC